jgi:hypothetical protein
VIEENAIAMRVRRSPFLGRPVLSSLIGEPERQRVLGRHVPARSRARD